MNPPFYIDSVRRLLSVDAAWTIVAVQREIQKTVTLTKRFPRRRPLLAWATEFVAAVFAVFYLAAALALGGALLFFSFCH